MTDFAPDPRLRETILQCGVPPLARPADFITAISPGDQMLLHSLATHGDFATAASQYFNVALQQHALARQLLDRLFPGDVPHVLDFACGFGRFLRFAVADLPRDHLSASELQADALRFVESRFSVPTFASCADPADFHPARSFDFIWVVSLFSHLPEPLFHAWLAKLAGMLKPHGVLAFSVRGDKLLAADAARPASGISYSRNSENADLDGDIYGTTYVSDAFVRGAIEQACGKQAATACIARGLANEQDLWLISPRREDLGCTAGVRRGVWGWLDRKQRGAAQLELEGWAGSLDDDAVDEVVVTIDDTKRSVRTGIDRPDVAVAFGEPRLATAGWRLVAPAPEHAAWVEVIAQSGSGQRALLYAGEI